MNSIGERTAVGPSRREQSRRGMKTAERVARDLVDQIVDANMPDGTRLPPERDLVEVYGIGRSTVREALRLLEANGVISIRPGPGGGATTRRPDADDFGSALQLLLQFERVSLAAVLEARDTIEPAVAALAATRITSEQLDELRASHDAITESLDNHDLFMEQTRRFQETVAAASGNVVLRLFQDALISVAEGVVADMKYSRARRKAIATAYTRLLDGFETGDPALASAIAREFVTESRRYWHRHFSIYAARRITWGH
jgi:GntR family transcriptional repressor for pyruvate dehydrogenase complex